MTTVPTTLYALSDELTTWLQTIDCTDPDTAERAECECAIQRYMEQLPAKVDAIAAMLSHLEGQAELAADEIRRLQNRKQSFERAVERLELYCVHALEMLPEPHRGLRKLEGRTSTLTLRVSEGVMITDEPAIPLDFKTACIEMPARVWEGVVLRDPSIIGKLTKQDLKVRLVEVKKAIKNGEDVMGADLEYRNHLVRT